MGEWTLNSPPSIATSFMDSELINRLPVSPEGCHVCGRRRGRCVEEDKWPPQVKNEWMEKSSHISKKDYRLLASVCCRGHWDTQLGPSLPTLLSAIRCKMESTDTASPRAVQYCCKPQQASSFLLEEEPVPFKYNAPGGSETDLSSCWHPSNTWLGKPTAPKFQRWTLCKTHLDPWSMQHMPSAARMCSSLQAVEYL